MDGCLFCRIIQGEIPSTKVYEDAFTYAFADIHPQARVHVLVVSKKHTPDLANHTDLNDQELAAVLRATAKVAQIMGVAETGYRVVTNCGQDACQSVGHLHLHVLGGEKLSERMA